MPVKKTTQAYFHFKGSLCMSDFCRPAGCRKLTQRKPVASSVTFPSHSMSLYNFSSVFVIVALNKLSTWIHSLCITLCMQMHMKWGKASSYLMLSFHVTGHDLSFSYAYGWIGELRKSRHKFSTTFILPHASQTTWGKCFDSLISWKIGTWEAQKKKLNDGENEEKAIVAYSKICFLTREEKRREAKRREEKRREEKRREEKRREEKSKKRQREPKKREQKSLVMTIPTCHPQG